jgi:hypothetical protein
MERGPNELHSAYDGLKVCFECCAVAMTSRTGSRARFSEACSGKANFGASTYGEASFCKARVIPRRWATLQ